MKRGHAVSGSSPTVASDRPSSTIASVLIGGPDDTKLITSSASTISTNSAAGPTCSIASASGGANSIRPTIDSVPPMKLPTAAIISAGPARPLRAIS